MVGSRLKRSFVAGLVLVAPLAVTLFVLRILAGWALTVVDPLVRQTRLVEYTANIELVAQAIAVLLIVLVILLLGALTQVSVGRRLFGNFGRAVTFIPLVSTVYTSVRRITTSLVDRETGYDRVVLVEYPREGIYALGLVTAEAPAAAAAVTEGPVYNVFLPNSPNPTAGRLALVPEEQIHEIDVSSRRGMRLLVTMGIDDSPAALAGAEGVSVPDSDDATTR